MEFLHNPLFLFAAPPPHFFFLPGDHAELALAVIDCELRYGVSTAFAFFSNNRRSREFKEVAEDVLAHRSASIGRVDEKISAAERAGVLAPLRQSERAEGSALRLVTNCRVLREGTDVLAVDLVVFGDEKQSHVDIL